MRSWHQIALALCSAGSLAAGTWLVIAPATTGTVSAAPAKEIPAQSVVVLASDVAPGRLLRPEDLTSLPWPDDQLPAGSIVSGSPQAATLAGSVTRRPLVRGELLVATAVVAPGERGFLAAIVAPGRRAVAVAVDATSAAGGLIWPGDRVDVILTQTLAVDEVSQARRVVGETILSDVRVLSIDQRLDSPKVDESPARIPATVTLEVNGAQAERLAVGAQLGRLSLALRPVASDASVDPQPDGSGTPTWAGTVSPALNMLPTPRSVRVVQGPAAPAPRSAPPRPTVNILRGSESS